VYQVVPEMRETHRKLENDPMFALEHMTDDVQKQTDTLPTMERLEKHQAKWKDDYIINKIARNKVCVDNNNNNSNSRLLMYAYFI